MKKKFEVFQKRTIDCWDRSNKTFYNRKIPITGTSFKLINTSISVAFFDNVEMIAVACTINIVRLLEA